MVVARNLKVAATSTLPLLEQQVGRSQLKGWWRGNVWHGLNALDLLMDSGDGDPFANVKNGANN